MASFILSPFFSLKTILKTDSRDLLGQYNGLCVQNLYLWKRRPLYVLTFAALQPFAPVCVCWNKRTHLVLGLLVIAKRCGLCLRCPFIAVCLTRSLLSAFQAYHFFQEALYDPHRVCILSWKLSLAGLELSMSFVLLGASRVEYLCLFIHP